MNPLDRGRAADQPTLADFIRFGPHLPSVVDLAERAHQKPYKMLMMPSPLPMVRADAEARVTSFLADRSGEMLEFARQLISIPSPNPPGDERAIADAITDHLRALGIDQVERHGISDERPNLVITVTGDRPGPTLVLAGHTDTKPAGDLGVWGTDPWDPVVRDGALFGLGSGDMKVAVAAMTYAAAALLTVPFAGRPVLVFTADEEAGSELGSNWLAEQGLLEADAAIIGEPAGVEREWESLPRVTRRRAVPRQRAGHADALVDLRSRPWREHDGEGGPTIEKMDHELRSVLRFTPHPLCPTGPTVNVGVMASAGVYFGVYPGNAEFPCDIRTLPGMAEEQLIEDVEAFLAAARAPTPSSTPSSSGSPWCRRARSRPMRPSSSRSPARHATCSATRRASSAFPGATDAPYFQLAAGIPTVASFGPGLLPRAHGPNEHLAADGATLAAKVYAVAALRFFDHPWAGRQAPSGRPLRSAEASGAVAGDPTRLHRAMTGPPG